MDFCCDKFRTYYILPPDGGFGRRTEFVLLDDKYHTNFSDGEYGDIPLDYCPFCGTKLIVPKTDNKQG